MKVNLPAIVSIPAEGAEGLVFFGPGGRFVRNPGTNRADDADDRDADEGHGDRPIGTSVDAVNGTADAAQCDQSTENLADHIATVNHVGIGHLRLGHQFPVRLVRLQGGLLHRCPVLLFSLGHFDDAICSSGEQVVVLNEILGLGERPAVVVDLGNLSNLLHPLGDLLVLAHRLKLSHASLQGLGVTQLF